MATIGGSNIATDGLVLALDAANPNNFPEREPTTNVFPSPVSLGSTRITAAQIGAIFTDFSTGSYNNGPFVRLTRNVNSLPSPITAWDFEYSNSSTGYPNGTKHVFSFYARSVDGSTPTIKMSIPDAEPQTFNLTTQWQRFVGIFTLGIQAPGTLWVRINRSNQQWVSGSSYDISNAQIEFKSYATPFISGSITSWYDTSGNNISGSLVNGPIYSFANLGSIIFDSTDDKISLPAGSNFAYGTGDFSVEGWFYQTAIFSAYGDRIFCQTVGGTNYFVIQGGTDVPTNSQPQIVFSFPTGTITSPTLYSLNQWNYLCISRISNVVSIYLNGTFTVSGACTFNFTDTTYVPTIGAFTHTNSNNFHGRIAIIRTYKGVGLTSTQVSQNYNAQKSRYNL